MRRLKDKTRKARDGGALHFDYDRTIEHKLIITASPDGFLKRVRAIGAVLDASDRARRPPGARL